MPDDYRTREEIVLHKLIDALELHGITPNVGLMLPSTFPQHRADTGARRACELGRFLLGRGGWHAGQVV